MPAERSLFLTRIFRNSCFLCFRAFLLSHLEVRNRDDKTRFLMYVRHGEHDGNSHLSQCLHTLGLVCHPLNGIGSNGRSLFELFWGYMLPLEIQFHDAEELAW